jgi:hypothetical protein
MPRPIFIPLSGRDRRFAREQLSAARDQYRAKMREAETARAAGERFARAADKAFCEAWHAAMFSGGPAQPSPTIEQAVNSGFCALEVQCSRCNRASLVDLAGIERPASTELWRLEASLNCRPCRETTRWRAQAYIVGLRYTGPDDPSAPAAAQRGR